MTSLQRMKKIDLAEKSLDRISQWIITSDAKAGFILAFHAAFIAFLSTKSGDLKRIITMQPLSWYQFLVTFLFIVFAYLVIKSIYHAIKSLNPDIAVREASVFFFGSIAGMGITKFKKSFTSMSEEDVEEELNNQVFINSQIAVAKFTNVRSSINNLLLAFFAWVILLIATA